jgi:hypothetical protein
MYIPIDNVSQFRNHFAVMGREHQFSYEALELLYEFLEENTEGYELDVVALCCEYAQDRPGNIAYDHGLDCQGEPDAAILDTVIEYLEQHTQVVGVTETGIIVYAQF